MSSRLVRFSSHVSERSDEACTSKFALQRPRWRTRELLLDRTRRMELADKRPRSALGADLARRSGERIAARPSQPWQLRSSCWPAPAPSCPSATISTSTTTADAPRQPVTTDDQPGPASVPRRALIVRSERSSSTRLNASSGNFSQRASGAPPSEQRVRKRQSTQSRCMRHDAPPARPRCGHRERGHR